MSTVRVTMVGLRGGIERWRLRLPSGVPVEFLVEFDPKRSHDWCRALVSGLAYASNHWLKLNGRES